MLGGRLRPWAGRRCSGMLGWERRNNWRMCAIRASYRAVSLFVSMAAVISICKKNKVVFSCDVMSCSKPGGNTLTQTCCSCLLEQWGHWLKFQNGTKTVLYHLWKPCLVMFTYLGICVLRQTGILTSWAKTFFRLSLVSATEAHNIIITWISTGSSLQKGVLLASTSP